MFASGVDGDTTAVLSEVFALDEASAVLIWSWQESAWMQCDRVQRTTYKLFEAGGRMDDRGRRIVRVYAGTQREGGVEAVRAGVAILALRAHHVVGAWRADVAHAVVAKVVDLGVVFNLQWG